MKFAADPNAHTFRYPGLFDPRYKKYVGRRCIHCHVAECHAESNWCPVAARQERARKAARAALERATRKALQ